MTTRRSHLADHVAQIRIGVGDMDALLLELSLLLPPESDGCKALVRAALHQRESLWALNVAHAEASKP